MGVFLRMIAIAGAAALASACANERAAAPFAFANAAAMTTGSVDATERDAELRAASKQTIAGKVLAAIALERVTGRKPDPSRMAELR